MYNIVRVVDLFLSSVLVAFVSRKNRSRHRPQIKGAPFDRGRRRCDAARYRQGMKKLTVLGIIGGAALLAAVPLSFHCRNGA